MIFFPDLFCFFLHFFFKFFILCNFCQLLHKRGYCKPNGRDIVNCLIVRGNKYNFPNNNNNNNDRGKKNEDRNKDDKVPPLCCINTALLGKYGQVALVNGLQVASSFQNQNILEHAAQCPPKLKGALFLFLLVSQSLELGF
jgi:hypothetical protein